MNIEPLIGAILTNDLEKVRDFLFDYKKQIERTIFPLSNLKQGTDRDHSSDRIYLTLDQEGRDGFTPLALAAWKGNKEIIKLLLKHGASPNMPSRNGYTPIFFAIHRQDNKPELLDVFLHGGANINLKSPKGETPLVFAIKKHRKDMARRLLKRGANANISDNENNHPLILMIECGWQYEAIISLKRGADINACERDGNPAVYHAFKKGLARIMRFLLRDKANRDFLTKYDAPCINHFLMPRDQDFTRWPVECEQARRRFLAGRH